MGDFPRVTLTVKGEVTVDVGGVGSKVFLEVKDSETGRSVFHLLSSHEAENVAANIRDAIKKSKE